MIIDASNGKIVNSKEVYIHDDVLEEFCFYRAEKKLHISVLKNESNYSKSFSIDFMHVIGFEMTSCDFWGPSSRILDFEYVEKCNNTIIPKLFKIKDDNDYQDCTLSDQEKYIETIITFISGDRLRVACGRIIM